MEKQLAWLCPKVTKNRQPAALKLINSQVISCLFKLYKKQNVKMTNHLFHVGEGGYVPDYPWLGARQPVEIPGRNSQASFPVFMLS